MSKLINNTLRLNKLSGVIELTEEDFNNLKNESEKINKNSILPVNLLVTSENEVNMPEDKLLYLINNGVTCDYNYKGYSIIFTKVRILSRTENFVLTSMRFTNDRFNIMGIKVGMKFEDAQTILKYMSFIVADIKNISEKKMVLKYKKSTGNSIITLHINKEIVTEIEIDIY